MRGATRLAPLACWQMRPGEFHGHARAAEAAEGIVAAGQSRMDDGGGLGQLRAGLVVVGDDQFDAQFAGEVRLVDAADAAIDGDEQFALVGGQRADGLGVQSVAFVDAMGDVVADVGAEQFQAEPEDGGAGHAVDVVIAVDDDSPSCGDGGMDAAGGLFAAGQQVGIAQGGELRIEKIAGDGRDRSRRGRSATGPRRRECPRRAAEPRCKRNRAGGCASVWTWLGLSASG